MRLNINLLAKKLLSNGDFILGEDSFFEMLNKRVIFLD